MTTPGQPQFEVRDLTIGHESVWNALVAFFDQRGCDLVRGPDTGPDSPPFYFVSPRSLRR